MSNVGFVTQTSLRDFLTALASAEAPHGTVSAAAFAAAIRTSLLVKAAALPKTKSDSTEDRTVLVKDARGATTTRPLAWEGEDEA